MTTTTMYGTLGADTLAGKELGPDQGYQIHGLLGNDLLVGASGSDALHGGSGADNLLGLNGNDQLLGSYGNDSLFGGNGNDSLNGGQGADKMEGGYGNDSYLVDDAGDVVAEVNLGGNDMIRSSISYTLGAHVENLELTGPAELSGTGNALSNLIFGNDANNILRGEAGSDMVRGASGDDTVHGGSGSDKLFGEAGHDTLYGNSGGQRGSGADSAGDFLDGGSGDDELHGEGGKDQLWGGGGDDLLHGGAGDDRLVGGMGRDQFTGGDGADTFVFRTAFDIKGHEFIHGFQTGVDKIDLSGIDANGALAGNGTFAFLGEGQPGKPVAGSIWLESTGSATFVHGDLNGDGVTDMRLDLWGATVAQGDLIL